MTTQESIDRLIGLMDAKMIELEAMQGAMKEVVRFLMQQKDAQGKNAPGVTELTIREKALLLEEQSCPDCGSMTFYKGPEGGLSTNIKCFKCGSKYNVCPPYFAERI